jgi:RimJ/RimL family protein N-acetyltransferase
MVPETFSTPRLRAERMAMHHLDDLRIMDRDAAMMALIGGVREEPRTTQYLERQALHWQEHGFGFWTLIDIASGTAIGRAGLRRLTVDHSDVVEIEMGYGLLPAFWGRGLGTEIAGACLRHAFEGLGAPSVVALTNPDHVVSQRVLVKVGLTFDRNVTVEARPLAMFRGYRPEPQR